jgi:hypothetical protein
VSGTVITADWGNTTLNDVATALTDSLSRSGKGGMTAPFTIADGTVSAPALSFVNESSTGFYRAGAGDFRISILGADAIIVTPGGVSFTAPMSGSTPAPGDNSTLFATTAYVVNALLPKAPLASPALTGVPTAPTPTAGDNSTQIATSAFVNSVAMNAALPAQVGHPGEFVTTDGSTASWAPLVIPPFLLFSEGVI